MVEALWDSQQLWLSTQAQASQNCRTVGEGVMGLLPPLVEGLSEVDGCGEGSHSPSSMPTWAAVIGLSRLLTKRKKRKGMSWSRDMLGGGIWEELEGGSKGRCDKNT